METSRIALIRFDAPDGSPCVASGLLVSDRHVLTVDHAADGTRHRVTLNGVQVQAAPVVRTGDRLVDLAVLCLSEPVSAAVPPLAYGRVSREQAHRVAGCVAVGFPRWKKNGARRLSAQVEGWVPAAEDLDADADGGLCEGFLTLVGDRNPPAPQVPPGTPLIPGADLTEHGGSQWGGMSGAGVVMGNVLIGVVRSHNLAAGGQSLTLTPISAIDRLPGDLRQRFRAVLGITEPELPVVGSASLAALSGSRAPTLSPDVRESFRAALAATLRPYGLPGNWDLDELSELRRKTEADGLGACRATDLLTALCEALAAKPVFRALGGDLLRLEELQLIYEREIRAWPEVNSADALLVEAADRGIAERRSPVTEPLGALARFMVGVAATRKVPLADGAPLASWVESTGHQVADARAHYAQRLDDPAWLILDLGDEPKPGTPPWPDLVTWMVLTGDDVIPGTPVPCQQSADGLRRALARVMRQVQALAAGRLFVDLAVPRALMDEGIEHWPVIDVDEVPEPLSAWHSPRLRWARRYRDARLYYRLLDRTTRASWHGEAHEWMTGDPRRACYLGGRDAQVAADPLRALLREGGGFAIWFPRGLRSAALEEIGTVVRGLPEMLRRNVLPDYLPRFEGSLPAIIWDDPRGRGGFRLPPILVPESPQ